MRADDPYDPFHPDNLRLKSETLAGIAVSKPAQSKSVRKRATNDFAIFPAIWMQKLLAVDAGKHAYRLAWYLLFEAWRNGGKRIIVTNGLAAKVGVSRQRKPEAIDQLEAARLLDVKHRERKSPIVKVLLAHKYLK